ncbi:uncharacterized protein A1O5_06807 [Cladophialophora psammophila CBS 110553]|uniref:Uncharacterized protein n=1 Tax=Cladophialophora psammophila CBS 110553 TaxID=1182543 RepID=W9WYJ8_9EURO|nr:uncharacterized protein A1O5_06807 [Cladophialophora psammophila CBS 110553]EXJ69736.1 hypothetical protein A1O5_06807 [Cladophialophora psammophila CBS 110553]
MGNAYSWIRAIAWAKEHWYHAAVTGSVVGLTGSFSAAMACGVFRACDDDPCGTPNKKSPFGKPACDMWEHGGEDMLPLRRRDGGGTTVTVINGMRGFGYDYDYGEVPGVSIYNGNNVDGEVLHLLDKGEDELTITIPGSSLPDWIYITNAGKAPMCIAGVRLTAPDGSEITMTGNLGRICGADYYESAVTVIANAEGKAASCVWIDRHKSNGLRLAGISFNLQTDEQELESSNLTSVEDLCRIPFIMLQDAQPALSRRQLIIPTLNVTYTDVTAEFERSFDMALVKSNLDLSSAVRMCEAEHTKGPHFVSLAEGLYCDTTTRRLYRVCDHRHRQGICFDTDRDELVQIGGDGSPFQFENVVRDLSSQTPGRVKVLKTFRHVDVWG